MKTIFSKSIVNFRELTDVKLIEKINGSPNVSMDAELANVLINNLLSNALKYNEKDTPVQVCYYQDYVEIINSGKKALNQPNHIFDRFYKEGNRSGSTGLGLSIVKKICDFYDFQPSYTFKKPTSLEESGQHIFRISFNEN